MRYSDRHRFQKWSRIRCKNFALLVSVSLVWPTSFDELFDGTDKILRPTIRSEGVNGSSTIKKGIPFLPLKRARALIQLLHLDLEQVPHEQLGLRRTWIKQSRPYSYLPSLQIHPWHIWALWSPLQHVLMQTNHLTEIREEEGEEEPHCFSPVTSSFRSQFSQFTSVTQNLDLSSVSVSLTPMWRTLKWQSLITR